MKFITGLLFLSFISTAFALHSPPNLDLNRNEKAIFVDFKTAKYVIEYDFSRRNATAVSTITFEMPQKGKAIMDLKPEASRVEINGEVSELKSISLSGASTARYLDKSLEPGIHTLEITSTISKNIIINNSVKSIRSAFWMSDLSDRTYLEQYLPTNLEYDQYKMDFEVKINGTDKEHKIYSNAEVKVLAKNHFELSAPAYFTASSLFYHMAEVGAYREQNAVFESIDGRKIPVIVYSRSSTETFMSRALSVLQELEGDYGPFPHNSVTIYGAGSGGMEYCGATITSLWALGHELIHSYFARGVMPARGNSGWIDEAIASWRDDGYPVGSSRSLSRTTMAGHSIYRRTTDRNAYSKGARFMSYLDFKIKSKGGLKIFLKDIFERRAFKPLLTSDFRDDFEEFYNEDVTQLFDTYVYGKNVVAEKETHTENPYHPRLSEKELLDLL